METRPLPLYREGRNTQITAIFISDIKEEIPPYMYTEIYPSVLPAVYIAPPIPGPKLLGGSIYRLLML